MRTRGKWDSECAQEKNKHRLACMSGSIDFTQIEAKAAMNGARERERGRGMTENGRKAVEDMTFFARESKAERARITSSLAAETCWCQRREEGRKSQSQNSGGESRRATHIRGKRGKETLSAGREWEGNASRDRKRAHNVCRGVVQLRSEEGRRKSTKGDRDRGNAFQVKER